MPSSAEFKHRNIKVLMEAMDGVREAFLKALIAQLKTAFIDDFMSAFSETYDQLLMSEKDLPNDPTAPSQIRDDVIRMVREKLELGASRLSIRNRSAHSIPGALEKHRGSDEKLVHMYAIHKSDLGIVKFRGTGGSVSEGLLPASVKNPPKHKLFAFYLVGMISDVVFISKKTYVSLGKRIEANIGRFGEGFLMDGQRYRNLLKARTAAGYQKVAPIPSYDEALHPFSGKGPLNFFEILEKKIDVRKYAEAAMKSLASK